VLTGVLTAAAQQAAQLPAQQQPPATLPPIPTPTFIPTLEVTLEPTVDPALAPLAPAVTPDAPQTSAAEAEALPVVLRARTDLELLADQAFGTGQRPVGWNGSVDSTDTQLPLLVRFDLELAAGSILGANLRPEGWFGSVVSVPLAFARDLRHDVELLADAVMGAEGIRPAGWQGDDPFMRCDRVTQALLTVLSRQGYGVQVNLFTPGYCELVELEIARFVEQSVLQPPVQVVAGADPAQSFDAQQPFRVVGPFTVAFLDRNARSRAGVIPEGTGYTPIGRSDFEFSNMMLIEGYDFRVYVDYLTTVVTTEQFEALPPVTETIELTSCDGEWCD